MSVDTTQLLFSSPSARHDWCKIRQIQRGETVTCDSGSSVASVTSRPQQFRLASRAEEAFLWVTNVRIFVQQDFLLTLTFPGFTLINLQTAHSLSLHPSLPYQGWPLLSPETYMFPSPTTGPNSQCNHLTRKPSPIILVGSLASTGDQSTSRASHASLSLANNSLGMTPHPLQYFPSLA